MRTESFIRNLLYGLASRLITVILSFASRGIILNAFGKDFMGIISLIINIMTLLSLADMGISTAMMYSYFKPLRDNNKDEIYKLLNFYRKVYAVIIFTILIIGSIGFVVLPMSYHVMDNTNIRVIYILFLTNTVASYLNISETTLLNAAQKGYIISMWSIIFQTLSVVLQIVFALKTRQYVFIILTQLVIKVVQSVVVKRKIYNEMGLKKGNGHHKIEKSRIKLLVTDISAVFLYKICDTMNAVVDNIVISKVITIGTVTLYSNYMLVTNAVSLVLTQVSASITPSVGDLNVEADAASKKKIFNVTNFMTFWMFGFVIIMLYLFFNDFIRVWIGTGYLLSNTTVILILVNFFMSGMDSNMVVYRNSAGLYKHGKFRPVASTIINLTLSIILGRAYGVNGVVIATITARLCTFFIYDPYIVYKKMFSEGPIEYFIKYFMYSFIVVVIAYPLSILKNKYIFVSGFLFFFIYVILFSILVNMILLIMFYNSEEIKWCIEKFKKILGGRKNKVVIQETIDDTIENKLLEEKVEMDIEAVFSKTGNLHIHKSVVISDTDKMQFGENIEINAGCKIYSKGGIKIGSQTVINESCILDTRDYNYNSIKYESVYNDSKYVYRPIEIGENVWIESNVLVLPGIKIGEGVIVKMGAVVTANIPDFAIIGGNPARIISYRDIEKYKELKPRK